MWKIRRIFDGEYGCEERMPQCGLHGGVHRHVPVMPGEEMKCLVVLENEECLTKEVMAEDKFLTENGLNEGDIWPEQ